MALEAPPGSLQKLYLLSLTEKNREIWSDPNQVSLLTRTRGLARPAYVWDLHRLADTVGQPSSSGDGYTQITSNNNLWRPLWASQFNDDGGSSVFRALYSGQTVASFTVGDATEFRYRGDIAFHPLVVQAEYESDDSGTASSLYNDSQYGEQVVLEALLFPAMPFVLTTTTPSGQHYGPLFATSISLSVSGENGLGAVEARISFDGGRAIQCDVHDAATPATTTHSEVTGFDDSGNPILSDVTDFYHHRTVNLADCMTGTGIWTDVDTMRSDLQVEFDAERAAPINHLVGMTLEMKQEVSYETPTPKSPRTDQHGPRFAAIHSRVVTGSFTYYSRTESFTLPLDDQLTMYFGNTFLLPMPNITWQNSKMALRGGAGYLHTYDFIARAATNAVSQGFTSGSEGIPVSEFYYGTQLLTSPPSQ